MATSNNKSRPPLLLLTLAALVLLVSTQRVCSLLVDRIPLSLPYHYGPLLSGEGPIELYLTFYGDFEPSERSTLVSFLNSLSSPSPSEESRRLLRSSSSLISSVTSSFSTSVSKWWSLTRHYQDLQGRHVSQRFEIKSEVNDNYSLGYHLKSSDIANLAKASLRRSRSLSSLGRNSMALVFTALDVSVNGFCMHSCGSHAFLEEEDHAFILEEDDVQAQNPKNAETVKDLQNMQDSHGYGEKTNPSKDYLRNLIPYAWVGNSKMQCPGFCAWPFAKPVYGPPMEPLKAPNGVGVDGMIISLAKVLVGTATNPFGDAYYQGDAAAFGLEAGGACQGQFGYGAYPGYPGKLQTDASTGASYNMVGADGTSFLLPWIWNPATQACAGNP